MGNNEVEDGRGNAIDVGEALPLAAGAGAKRAGAHSSCNELFLTRSITIYYEVP